MRARTLSAVAAVALAMAAPTASAQRKPAPDATASVQLLLALNGDPDLGRGVEARLQQYIGEAAGVAVATKATPARPVSFQRVEATGKPLDADTDEDAVNALIASRGAHAALIGDVSKRGDVVVTHATLVAPAEPESAETWVVVFNGERLSLPLAEGIYRFDAVNAGIGRVTDATQVQPQGLVAKTSEVLGDVTKLLGFKLLPVTRHIYDSTATISEDGVAAFVAAVLAYHAGDFERAEAQFARAEGLAQPGSNAERDAAVLQLASAARAALARAAADGAKPLGHWSGGVRDVDRLGKNTVARFPWSTEARQTLAMFHLAVAAAVPDHLIDVSRVTEAGAARRQANAIDKLADTPSPWAAQARRMADAISPSP